MYGLSNKEMELTAHLEYEEKHYFTKMNIVQFFSSENQIRHTIHKLLKKGRIIKLNREKYYMIPLKAPSGKWFEKSFILVDEIMNGKEYMIGGWAAAHYWHLTDQVPLKIEVHTTKRQGIKKFLTTTLIFRRTTMKHLQKSVEEKINNHPFRILSKGESEQWMKSRR